MRYDRLSLLIDQLREHANNFEYFFSSPAYTSAGPKRQRGVFRTNCIDCLDRTNVVQSLVATENLKAVLARLGVLAPSDDLLAQTAFQAVYRHTWADHADLVSLQYAGTGALKTDFTRTGRRGYRGLLQDGWNAAHRYVFNNFTDGGRTDGLRVAVGEFPVDKFVRTQQAALRRPRGAVSYLPALLALALAVLAFTLVTSRAVDGRLVVYVVLCVGFVGVVGRMILQHGNEFVNAPVTMKRTK